MEPSIVGTSQQYHLTNVQSIYTGRSAQWAYSPRFTGNKVIAQARIVLTGKRPSDYEVAELQTGTIHVPCVTVWHHVYDYNPANDSDTMQLVSWGHHAETIPHCGGCSAYAAHHHTSYNLTPQDQEALAFPSSVPIYSTRELDEFSLKTGLTLSPQLRRFYNGNIQLSKKALLFTAQQDILLDAVLPLTNDSGASVEEAYRLLTFGAAPSSGCVCFGMDAYGNLFCAQENGQILFYDHEQDLYFDTGISLNQLVG